MAHYDQEREADYDEYYKRIEEAQAERNRMPFIRNCITIQRLNKGSNQLGGFHMPNHPNMHITFRG